MNKTHHYHASVQWTGNKGTGTDHYRNYDRSHEIHIPNKTTILGSADSAFRGDPSLHNPEDLLVTALSSCHMLWYLHLCAEAGVIVTHYTDHAHGIMTETSEGSGHFTEVTLHPTVTVTEASMVDLALQLHHKANRMCFIANSVNFPVHHNAIIQLAT